MMKLVTCPDCDGPLYCVQYYWGGRNEAMARRGRECVIRYRCERCRKGFDVDWYRERLRELAEESKEGS